MLSKLLGKVEKERSIVEWGEYRGNLVFSQTKIKSEIAVSFFPTRTHWEFAKSISLIKLKSM